MALEFRIEFEFGNVYFEEREKPLAATTTTNNNQQQTQPTPINPTQTPTRAALGRRECPHQ